MLYCASDHSDHPGQSGPSWASADRDLGGSLRQPAPGSLDMSIRIMLADDHAAWRQHLQALPADESDVEFVAEAADGQAALRLVHALVPDLILMDVIRPQLSGIEAPRRILTAHPAVQVLALSMHADRRFVENMLRAGTSGYVLKERIFTDLVSAIRIVLAGQLYLSPPLKSLDI